MNNPDDSPFTRFNFKARKAVFRAIIEAHAFQASQLETEHLLLGISGLGADCQRDPADERAVTQLFGSSARAGAIRTAIESEFPSRGAGRVLMKERRTSPSPERFGKFSGLAWTKPTRWDTHTQESSIF